MRIRRWAAAVAAFGLVCGACVGGTFSSLQGPSASPSAPGPTPVQANPLCKPVPTGGPPGPTSGTLPPAIAQVASQVEQIRGVTFKHAVIPEAVTPDQMAQQVRASLVQQFPKDVADREGKTWITIGAIPPGTDLYQTVLDYESSEVIGYYDVETHRLVFLGGQSLTPFSRYILAHELTHALDDQNFNLARLDQLNNTCQDERAQAFLSLAEGDAVATQNTWAETVLSADEINQLQAEANAFPSPAPAPPFVENMFLFPYPNGQAFVQALQARGGEQAVDDAFRDPPVSTEQILHPSRYPNDVPQAVTIPDLSSKLGPGWSLLDQEEVGEGWLLTLLELRLSQADSEEAAGGWGGGLLRSWTDGAHVAAVIQTSWDSEGDAAQFAGAMKRWLQPQQAAEVHQDGTGVQVLFASDAATLSALHAAAAP